MAMNVTPFVGTDNFDMATFNNMISQINSGVNNEIQTLASQLGTQIDSKAKIQTGSYVGTGTYGASNPCSLTFDFEPKIVICSKSNGLHQPTDNSRNYLWFPSFIWFTGITSYMNMYFVNYSSSWSTLYTHFTLTDNTLFFYGDGPARHSDGRNVTSGINDSNTTYFFVGIG